MLTQRISVKLVALLYLLRICPAGCHPAWSSAYFRAAVVVASRRRQGTSCMGFRKHCGRLASVQRSRTTGRWVVVCGFVTSPAPVLLDHTGAA